MSIKAENSNEDGSEGWASAAAAAVEASGHDSGAVCNNGNSNGNGNKPLLPGEDVVDSTIHAMSTQLLISELATFNVPGQDGISVLPGSQVSGGGRGFARPAVSTHSQNSEVRRLGLVGWGT